MNDDLIRQLLRRTVPKDRGAELDTSPGCPRDECGFHVDRTSPRCGKPPVYLIRWDTGKRSVFCGPHVAEVRKWYGSRVERLEEYVPAPRRASQEPPPPLTLF